jgi:hypothetical protein
LLGQIDFYSSDLSTSSSGTVGRIQCLATNTFVGDCQTALTFHTNTGVAGTVAERMRIDSSGRLLIGGTTTYDFNGQSNLVVNGTANNSTITIASTSDGYLAFADGTTGTQAYVGRIGYFHTSNHMDFWTNGTERARIDSSGNLLVGTTSKLAGGIFGLDINHVSGSGLTLGISGNSKGFVFATDGTDRVITESASGYAIANISGGSGGVLLSNGGTSWGALSDERKKDIIEPIENAAEKVSSLRAVIGKYKTEEDGIRRSMLIAQDVQAVLPEAVVENSEGDLVLQYTETIPLLVAAIQELKAELDTVKAELATLKGN